MLHTVADILQRTEDFLASRGVDSPRLESELLVAHGLGVRRLDLYLDLKRPLHEAELAKIRPGVKRRGEREPLAYITGEKEFLARPFVVSRDVLIPRPETEHLVEGCYNALVPSSEADFERAAMALPKEGAAANTSVADNLVADVLNKHASPPFEPGPVKFADIGTGSGVIGVSLACLIPRAAGSLIDLSPEAIQIARQNAERNGCADRLTFYQGSLTEPLRNEPDSSGSYHLIAANLPYISPADRESLAPEILDYEPHMALFAPEDGYALSLQLIREALDFLAPDGWLVLEIGTGQAPRLKEEADAVGFRISKVLHDYAGHERVLMLQK